MIYTTTTRATALATDDETDNPFIAWDNIGATGTFGGTTTLTDGDTANAFSGTTYDYWLPDVTTTSCSISVTLASAQTLSFVGIAGHNISTYGGTVAVQRSTNSGGTWSDAGAGAQVPTDNSPIGFRMRTTGNDAADWRIRITTLTAGDPIYAAVLFFGNDMVFPRRFYRDFAPPIAPSEVQLQSNVSVGGNLLGNSIVAHGSTLNAQIRNLPVDFVRGDMLPFIPHYNAGKGMFFGWRPTTFDEDLRYTWREGATLRPVNSGPLDFMSIDLAMRAYET